MPGSIWARCAARISLVEIGSRPGLMRGPMMPPSMTIVSFGAWRCWASAAASSGTPTPANTVVSSRNCREPMMANSSADVNCWFIGVGSASPAHHVGGLPQARVAPVARSSRQLFRRRALPGEPLAAEELEVVVPRRRRVDVAREVLADGRLGAPRVDGGRIGAKVLEVRLVEAVAFVRERAERYLHQRVDEEAWDDGAIGVAARLLVGDQLLRRHEHGRRRPRD